MSNRDEMQVIPEDDEQLLQLLLRRHQVLLNARVSKNPGAFKDRNNRAGDTHFVDHTLVKGTLSKGFEFYTTLQDPFARAAYMMFLISEVHPFLDGNGRVARIMMNAELVHRAQTRIIIPTVFREDYIMALKKLTRKRDPGPYIRMLQRAQAFSVTIVGEDMDEMESHLIRCNAFKSPEEAHLIIP
jgi:fido (protein-threonine AMPylation protein)